MVKPCCLRFLTETEFEVTVWHRILVYELIATLCAFIRIWAFLNQYDKYHPAYWEYALGYIISLLIIFQPIKGCLLLIGILKKITKYLRWYSKINQVVVIPLGVPVGCYLRWRQWLYHPQRGGTALEILLAVLIISIGVWCIYFVVPRHLKALDSPQFEELQKYISNLRQNSSSTEMNNISSTYNAYDIHEIAAEQIVGNTGGNSTLEIVKIKLEILKKYLISPLNITIDKETLIGRGQFGSVYKGRFLNDGQVMEVAAKTTRITDLDAIVQEMKTNVQVGIHQNVVRFLGVSSDSSTEVNFYLVTQFCERGCLKDYLERLRPIYHQYKSIKDNKLDGNAKGSYVNLDERRTVVALYNMKKDLMRFSKEICSGMLHLSSKRVIHGDLSARNVMLTEALTAKIGDFGMSRRLYNSQMYSKELHQENLPWRWMAIECIEDLKFSEKTDVWALGVTLWEIFSLGEFPLSGVNWSVDISRQIRAGELILEQPVLADDKMYQIMESCWNIESSQRPDFKDLQEMLIHK